MMNRMACLLGLTLAAAAPAFAQDYVLGVGVTRYDTHARVSNLSGIGLPPGSDVQVGDATTVILVGQRMFTPNFGVELVLGVPPKITSKGAGSVQFLGKLLEAKNVAPTLLANWHFGQPGDAVRPYVGAGINYTKFIDVRSPYGWKLSLSDSWGPVLQAGLGIRIDDHWEMFTSVAAVKVKSDLVAVGANVIQATIDFRPLVYSAGLRYRF